MVREVLSRHMLAVVALCLAAPAALAAQAPSAPAPVRLASTAAPAAAAAAAAADTTAGSRTIPGRTEMISFERETYAYGSEGRRDPFLSLMSTGELRPLLGELRLMGIVYDERGGSVAMLRDIVTNERHRVRTGQTLGRMRVASIEPKKVVFTIEEFGFSRQESLALGESNTERTQQ